MVKVGILAGGLGSRLSEETTVKPKPMVEIGEYPILWHIMKYYASFGHTDFSVALGYKGEYIKRWFADRASLAGHLHIRTGSGEISTSGATDDDDWSVNLIETGRNTNTGGRIKRLVPYLGDQGTFMVTWGDGVATIDLDRLVEFHRAHGKICTLTAVHPPARYGHHGGRGPRRPQARLTWSSRARSP
jgi:glucose-1-phosphate cytidylyltransferase